ncbi:hypothetical protein FQY83_13090 [Luteimonas marina]|uniref:Uncharacterized protein n=1 Tax=Luteimonas marina TaxID=488485 RepID=A0A5C5U040_9GAMM|nr:hypothetical protein [Luteimonas marina]TWT19286.1 hypothetical protein FQY83_13090 [Luteimonas marina]
MSSGSSFPVFDWLAGSVRLLGFNAKPDADAFQLLLALGAALVAYALIHRSQKKAAEEGRRIERAKLLHELDREYYDIMSRKCVIETAGPPSACVEESRHQRLEWVLTSKVAWNPQVELEGSGARCVHAINGGRHVRIGPNHYIDTISLHLMLSWSKRVSNGLRLDILSCDDVMEMWRSILPWAKNNRFSYMADLFGMSPTRESDIRAVLSLPLQRERRGPMLWLPGTVRMGGYRLREAPPNGWQGDIASLYHVIHVVVLQALRRQRLEILDYLRQAPADAAMWSGMDAKLRDALIVRSGPEESTGPGQQVI